MGPHAMNSTYMRVLSSGALWSSVRESTYMRVLLTVALWSFVGAGGGRSKTQRLVVGCRGVHLHFGIVGWACLGFLGFALVEVCWCRAFVVCLVVGCLELGGDGSSALGIYFVHTCVDLSAVSVGCLFGVC